MSKTVAVVKWSAHDEIADALGEELAAQHYGVKFFQFDQALPSDATFVLSFAPYGRFLQIPQRVARLSKSQRPFFIHWSTENPPDLRLPWRLNRALAAARSWFGRTQNELSISKFQNAMIRYRIMGDYLYAHRQGWLDLFVESSMVFADWYNAHAVPTHFAPWGSVKKWYADLNLERDIDVLWMGKRRTQRRSQLLERIRVALETAGYRMFVADDEEHPFLYDQQRIEFLNRAKITLSVLAGAPHDNIFQYRFRLAAPNRSLVITEHELAHCTVYQENVHYIAATADTLIETLLFYLAHADARANLVAQAYELATTQMTLGHSVRAVMAQAEAKRAEM